MKIAYLTADFGVPVLGTKGASVHVRQLVSALADCGHDLLVMTPTPGSGLADQIGCRVAEIPLAATLPLLYEELSRETICEGNRLAKDIRNILYNVWLELQAQPVLEDFRPDFLYERYSLFGTGGLQLARRFDVPLLLEVNAPLVEEQQAQRGLTLPGVARTAERLLFSEADHIFVVSKALHEHCTRHGADPERVTVLPNAADPYLFCPPSEPSALRRALKWDDRFVIGFVGSMKGWHGVSILLEAMHKLGNPDQRSGAQPGNDFRLLLVGDGPESANLQAQAQRLGLRDVVHFTGAVTHEEVPDWVAAMDVAVAPYAPSADGYFSPVKLFEYMAMARPVVAARIGQTGEIIDHGCTGWLYRPGDSDELARCLRHLADDREAGERAGAEARERVLARHTWRHNADRVLAAARSAMAGRPGDTTGRLRGADPRCVSQPN